MNPQQRKMLVALTALGDQRTPDQDRLYAALEVLRIQAEEDLAWDMHRAFRAGQMSTAA